MLVMLLLLLLGLSAVCTQICENGGRCVGPDKCKCPAGSMTMIINNNINTNTNANTNTNTNAKVGRE